MTGGLKKEFKESDLSRIRNIIKGRYGDKTKSSVGFEKKKQEYKEGDIWEENDKKWTIKNGIKQTISRLDSLKELTIFPLLCPNCENSMKSTPLNKKMYNIHKMCLNCVTEKETRLKIEGGFDDYKNDLMDKNKLSALDELEQILDEYANMQSTSFITESGEEERWDGGAVDTEFIAAMKEKIRKEKNK